MSATTLRIDSRQKERIDRLQARLRVLTGRRVTHDELIRRMLDELEGKPEVLTGREWKPLSKAEIRRVMEEVPMHVGFELGDVDEVLYGRKRRARA